MAQLTTAKHDRLRDGSFAYIDKDGERHLPNNDESHVRNAIARFDQTDFEDASARHAAARKIMSAARRHEIEVDDSSDVAKAAKRCASVTTAEAATPESTLLRPRPRR